MNGKMKPCPFCGSIPKLRKQVEEAPFGEYKAIYRFECPSPKCRGRFLCNTWLMTPEDAAKDWNYRASYSS